MNNPIKLIYVENKTKYEGNVSRDALMRFMKQLVDSFPENHEIAAKMIKIIPDMEYMEINKDISDTQDVPSVKYKIGEKESVLKIIRYHKIIWGFFDNLCQIVKMS